MITPGIFPSQPSSIIAKGVRCLSSRESFAPISTILSLNHALGRTAIACDGNSGNAGVSRFNFGLHAIGIFFLFEVLIPAI